MCKYEELYNNFHPFVSFVGQPLIHLGKIRILTEPSRLSIVLSYSFKTQLLVMSVSICNQMTISSETNNKSTSRCTLHQNCTLFSYLNCHKMAFLLVDCRVPFSTTLSIEDNGLLCVIQLTALWHCSPVQSGVVLEPCVHTFQRRSQLLLRNWNQRHHHPSPW